MPVLKPAVPWQLVLLGWALYGIFFRITAPRLAQSIVLSPAQTNELAFFLIKHLR